MNKPFAQAGVALFKNIEEFFIPSDLVLGNIGSLYISAVVFGAGFSLPVRFGQGLGKVLYGLYLCCLCMSQGYQLLVLFSCIDSGTTAWDQYMFCFDFFFDKFAKMEQWMASYCVSMSIMANPLIERIPIQQFITNNHPSFHISVKSIINQSTSIN